METSLDSLRNSSLSSDDSRPVDSILNDLNGPSQNQGPPQNQGGPPSQPSQPNQAPQMSPEQQKMMLEQRQQQIMMQQMAAQRQQQQQQQQQQANILRNKNVSILDDLKNESGKLFIILVLSILIHSNLGDAPFNMYPDTFLVPDGTNLNMTAITVKSIILALAFYGIHILFQ